MYDKVHPPYRYGSSRTIGNVFVYMHRIYEVVKLKIKCLANNTRRPQIENKV